MAVIHNAVMNNAVSHNRIFYPASFDELFSVWESFPEAAPYAGGTDITRRQANTLSKQPYPGRPAGLLDLPQSIICLDRLKDLFGITRTEKYLEIGSMVKLNRIINLGKIVPEVFADCLKNTGGNQLRNIATIGGNICRPACRPASSAPLIALDAQFELKKAKTSLWMSANRFFSLPQTALGRHELLTRIRIPLDQWDYSVYKKFKNQTGSGTGEALVFMVKTQKNILTSIRVVCKTGIILRSKDIEAMLIGKSLPLGRKIAGDFAESWNHLLSGTEEISEVSRGEFLNSITEHIYNLC